MHSGWIFWIGVHTAWWPMWLLQVLRRLPGIIQRLFCMSFILGQIIIQRHSHVASTCTEVWIFIPFKNQNSISLFRCSWIRHNTKIKLVRYIYSLQANSSSDSKKNPHFREHEFSCCLLQHLVGSSYFEQD